MTLHPPPEPSSFLKEKRVVRMVCAGLAGMVLLVFGQTLRNGFVNFDDDIYVNANPHVAKGFTTPGIIWAFTSSQPTGNWHPLTWLSHMLDCQIYGLNPVGHHLTNVLLHATTTILLFLLLKRMTGALWPSALVAAVFALHPLRVESVAWISERKDLLSGLLFMLTLLMYVRYVQKRAAPTPQSWIPAYGLVLLFFTLGLMAKPMLVTLPFVLLLLDYWPLQRFTIQNWRSVVRPLLVEKAPLFLLTAVVSAVTYFTQKSAGAVAPTLPVIRFENALLSYVSYIIKMFWPENLAVLYPYPLEMPTWKAVVAGALLLLVTGLVIVRAKRFRYLVVGWLWYLGMLVPVIGIVQAGEQAMADRFSYLPQIGLYLALVWGVKDLVALWRLNQCWLGVAAAVVLAALMRCSLIQISYWRNSETLWTHTLACAPANPVAQIDLGAALGAEGRQDEAIEHYQQAIKIRPDHPYAYLKLGLALIQSGRFDEAIQAYETALQIEPNDADTHNNLANLLVKRNRPAEAAEHYQEAIRINPDYAAAHNNLANLLAAQGRFDDAIPQYQEAIRLNPRYAQAQYNFARVLVSRDQPDEALEHYQKALQINPDYAEAHCGLANVLAKQNKLDDALEHYQRAVQIDPDLMEAQYDLGVLLAFRARLDEAADHFRIVIKLKPDYVNAHGNLANVLMGQGKTAEAIAEYQQTIHLEPDSDQAHYKLGLALEKQNEPAGAIEQFQQALRLNPKHAGAQKELRSLGAWPN